MLLLMVMAGWLVANQLKSAASSEVHKISVIVPFRDESIHLHRLLNSIERLDFPSDQFELILVNDHSTDESLEIVEQWRSEHKLSSSIVSLTNEYGKKQALLAGVSAAHHEWIATTDADCEVSPNWLKQISQNLQPHHQMLLGLVIIEARGFWSRLQQMEFFSVMSLTISSWGWSMPIMCNGANLAFRKPAFLEVGGYDGNLHLASGDDEFLLRKMVSRYGSKSIGFHQATVVTQPQPNLKTFLHQRIRWASKWGSESNQLARWLALLMLVVQLSWWPLLGIYFSGNEPLFAVVIGTKVLIEFWILYSVSLALGTRFHLLSFLILQVAYAPYVVWVALLSRVRSVKWKGRPIIHSG